MAQLSFSGLDELMLSLQEVAEIPDEIQDQMLNAGADVLIPEIKARGEGYGVEDTGLTLKSLAKSKVKKNKNDGRYLTVYFKGSRKRGEKRIRNGEIAFFAEYGVRHRGKKERNLPLRAYKGSIGGSVTPPRPFMMDSVALSQRTISNAQQAIYDKWLKSKNL